MQARQTNAYRINTISLIPKNIHAPIKDNAAETTGRCRISFPANAPIIFDGIYFSFKFTNNTF
jgi:hypothetical protein